MGSDVRLNACVGRNGGPYTTAHYASSYFLAAKILSESLYQNPLEIDSLIYPVAYLYRHAIELTIKELCKTLPTLWNEKPTVKPTHKLIDNWDTVKSYLKRNPAFDQHGILIDQVDKLLKELVEIDATGETFRYAQDKKGNNHLQETSHINLKLFSEAMENIKETFIYWNNILNYEKYHARTRIIPAIIEIEMKIIDDIDQIVNEFPSNENIVDVGGFDDEPDSEYVLHLDKLMGYLKGISAHDRAELAAERRKVLDAIDRYLRHEPTQESKSRIKRLRRLATPQYRLRIDDIRVFYDIVEGTVEIIAVIAKAQAAEWLAREGILAEQDPQTSHEEEGHEDSHSS
jgi:mRNA-degrading endonuclease RelE of RelBE toxin-antitoxin system